MMNDPVFWWSHMNPQQASQELLLFLACIAVTWLLVWGVRRATPQWDLSVLLGRRLLDGVLFPTLLLGLVFITRAVWAKSHPLWIFDFLVPVCFSLAVIRLGVKVLQVTFKSAEWVRPIERSLSWLAWAAVVLWLTGLLPLVLEELDQIKWKIGASHLSVRTLIEGGLTAGLVMLLTLWVSSAIESKLLKSSTGSELSLRKAVSNAVTSLLLFVGLMLSLSAVGIDLTALSVLGGAVGVGIGFGLQKLAANYVSGFVILLERSLRIGDNIVMHSFEGQVVDITTRYTLIRGANGQDAVVPNQDLTTGMVLKQRRDVPLPFADGLILSSNWTVKHDSDVDVVQAALVQAALAVERVIHDPAPQAQLREVTPLGLQFTLVYWIKDPMIAQLSVRSEVNLAVLQALRDKGVVLAVAALEWRQPA
jgi:small-conductance mechanosensitive channel